MDFAAYAPLVRRTVSALALLLLFSVAARAQSGTLIYVSNFADDSVSVYSTNADGTLTPVTTLAGMGVGPAGTAVRGDQAFAYVVSNTSQEVRVIDTRTHTVVQTVAGLNLPLGIAVSPDGTRVYVAEQLFGANTVSVFAADATTGLLTPLTTIVTGPDPRAVVFSPDGRRAYVGNQDSGGVAGSASVSVIDTAANTVVASIGVPFELFDIAINPSGTRVYAVHTNGVAVIDTASDTVVATVTATLNAPHAVAVHPDGTRFYVANTGGSGSISQFDASSNAALGTLPAGSGQSADIGISPTGAFVYASGVGGPVVEMFTYSSATGLLSGNGNVATGSQPFFVALCGNGNAMLATGATFMAKTATALNCAGSTATFTGGTLQVNEPGLTFTSPIVLGTGGGTIDTNGNTATFSGVFSGTGGLTKSGAGTLQAGAANVFPSAAGVTVSSGTLALNNFTQTIGSLAGAGTVSLGTATLTAGGNNSSTTFSGAISGTGALTKSGTGTLLLTGVNTFTGTTTVDNGTLGGTGTIAGPVTLSPSGTLDPGVTTGILGIGSLTVGAGALKVQLNGPVAGVEYDQLRVTGSVDLGVTTLFVTQGFTPQAGQVFVIIDNDGVDAVSGSLGGIPEGGVVTLDAVPFRVSYAGGTGNDVTLTALTDLTIAKTHVGTFTQGQTGAQYSIVVSNPRLPAIAAGSTITVTDTLPSGLTATALSGTGWACTLGTRSCTRSDALAGGASYPAITVTVTVAIDAASTVTNSASVAVSAAIESDSSNNVSSDTTTILQAPDLTIAKAHAGSLVLGQTGAQYTLTVTNSGGNLMSGATVTVTDALPSGLTATGLAGAGWTCSLGTLACTRTDALAASASYPVITLTVTVAANAPLNVTNTAAVALTGATESNTSNNTAVDATTTMAQADVALTVTAPVTVTAGQNITYTITVTNGGPSDAAGVTATDVIPAGTTLVSATATQGSCSGTTTVTCSLGAIVSGSGAMATLVVSTAIGTGTPVSNTVTVTSATADPVSGNNTATLSTSLGCTAMTATPAALVPGLVGGPYSQTVNATGGVAPVTFALTGTLPPGVSFSAGSFTGRPTERGAFPTTLTATDARGCQASFPYTIAVSRERVLGVSAGSGGGLVRTFNTYSGAARSELTAYGGSFTGGASIALGDTNDDGVPDTIAGAGPGGGPHVKVIDGATGAVRLSFFAYETGLRSGVEVAAGDVNGDGAADIITAPGDGGPPIVRLFDGRTGGLLNQYAAMIPSWTFGLHVAAGDVDGNGLADIIVGSGPNGPPVVQVIDARGNQLRLFDAFGPSFNGGVYVAAGDVTGDGFADIVTGSGPGSAAEVRSFDGRTGARVAGTLGSLFPYGAFAGGVRVGAGDFDGDGRAEVITAAGPGGGPHLRVFDGATGGETYGLYVFEPSFAGGVFVAGPPALARMNIDLLQPGFAGSNSVRIAGWALHEQSALSLGTDAVHAWAFPVSGAAPVFVGAAGARGARPDVAHAYGGEFYSSAFDFLGTLAPGTYDIVVYVRNTTTLQFDNRRIVRIVMP